MVDAVVDDFYGKVRRDALLGPVFNRIIAEGDWPRHLRLIADFWSSMLLGTGRYDGRPMPKHLAIPELNDAHFARWLSLFRETVETICPEPAAALFVERAERIGFNFRLRIAQHRGHDPERVLPMRAERPGR
ncbi:MAG: group III truncated hemoglobin [Devosia sp.]|nr:group III truncated hemoglobin [Devosia sp.]